MFKCEIIADSINPQNDRLTTMKITFPRFILAEFNTHRMFSRNSASSRAIPFEKMVKMVEENPFIPIAWQKDHKGMQGTEYFTDEKDINNNEIAWLNGRNYALNTAKLLAQYYGTTKQLCNRLLEPFMWHTVIITATEWENFFKLRCPQYESNNFIYKSKKDYVKSFCGKDYVVQQSDIDDNEWNTKNKSQAEIHIQAIAELMWDAMNESTPKQLKAGEWHVPFGDNISFVGNLVSNVDVNNKHWLDHDTQNKVKIATARCARISYETLGDNPKIDYNADIKLHDMLAESGHWSPFEHCARAMSEDEYKEYFRGSIEHVGCEQEHYDDGSYSEDVLIPYNGQGWCLNFKGFIQYRHLIETK